MIRLSPGTAPGTLRVEGLGQGSPARTLLQPGRTLTLNPQQAGDGQLVARLGRLLLPLPQSLGATAGQALTVRVGGTATQPLLEVVSQARRPATALQSAQRQYLPQQQPVSDAVGTLATAARPATAPAEGARAQPLPEAVTRLLGQLTSLLPTARQLSDPTGLRTALRDSGVLMEPLMAAAPSRASEIATRDLKAALGRLAARLRAGAESAAELPPRLGELGRASEGALARLALLQLGNSTAPEGRVDLAFELPVAHGNDIDELAIRIREEESDDEEHSNEAAERWEIALRFRFQGHSTLDARLRMTGERISVTWWSDDAALAQRVEAALPRLQKQLEAIGLEVAHVSSRQGSPPTPAVPEPAGGGLLDERV